MQPKHRQSHTTHKCIKNFILGNVFLLSLLVTCAQGDAYLKEAPSFMTPCRIHAADNEACVAKLLEHVFIKFGDGVPDLPSIDPFNVKEIHIAQDNGNINLNIDLKDAVIKGLSQANIVRANVSGNYNFKFLGTLNSFGIKAAYKMKGSILFLDLNLAGLMEADASDLEILFSLKTKLRKMGDRSFLSVTGVQSKIKTIANAHIHFDSELVNADELIKNVNTVFNENWRYIFEIIRPALEKVLEAIARDHFQKVFRLLPADKLFLDLP